MLQFAEPTVLFGEGEFNINVVKEIKVTDSYLGLGQEMTGCQMMETFDECTTRHFQNISGCVPFNIKRPGQVIH